MAFGSLLAKSGQSSFFLQLNKEPTLADNNRPTPKPSPRPAPPRETIERGYQPSGPPSGHQPSTGEAAPSNPPSRGSGGKK